MPDAVRLFPLQVVLLIFHLRTYIYTNVVIFLSAMFLCFVMKRAL